MKIKNLLAKNNVNLYDHSICVAEKAYELAELVGITDEQEKWLCFISGLLHDIGKCDLEFQKHISENSNSYIYHNILGGAILNAILKTDELTEKNIIAKCVLYHHPVLSDYSDLLATVDILNPYYQEILQEFADINNKRFPDFQISVTKPLDETATINGIINYFTPTIQSTENAVFARVSRILIFADVIVSKGTNVEDIVKRKYDITINDVIRPANYDDRFDIQKNYAKELYNMSLSVFESQTGFGKTMLGILYTLHNNRKTYWVTPRNSIAEGIFSTINKELKALNLSDKISVSLLLTNQWTGSEDADIIVTNIDNFLRPVIKNDSLMRNYDMIFSNVIFDEFHEFVSDDSLMAMFDIMLKSRKSLNSKTLCLSATPCPYFFGKDYEKIHIEYKDPKIYTREYNIEFIDNIKNVKFNKLSDYMVRVNSTGEAQKCVLNKYTDRCIHSRFLDSRIDKLKKDIFSEYGKDSIENEGKKLSYAGTSIIFTGIDYSINDLVIKVGTPDDTIQSIGRCNRWNDEKEHKIIFSKIGDRHKDSDYDGLFFIHKLYVEIAKEYYDFLKKELASRKTVAFGELYDLRKNFYKKCDKIEKLFKVLKNLSYNSLKNIRYVFAYKKSDDGDIKYIAHNVLRHNDKYEDFYCLLRYKNGKYTQELFVGSNIIFDFKRDSFTREMKNSFERKLFQEIKDNTNYFPHRKAADKVYRNNKSFLDFIKEKAYKSDTPLPIVENWYYTDILGIMRMK